MTNSTGCGASGGGSGTASSASGGAAALSASRGAAASSSGNGAASAAAFSDLTYDNVTTFFSGKRHFFHRDSTTLFRRSNKAYNSSVAPVRVAVAHPCAHDGVNRFVCSWWPPAGRHLEAGATEDFKDLCLESF
jgi:hypothetical protein